MTGSRRIDGIICFSTDPWGEMKRPGQLMLRLCERVPVVYVEPSLSVTSVVKNWRGALTADSKDRWRRATGANPVEVRPRVYALSSLVAVPPHRLLFLRSPGFIEALSRGQHRRMAHRAYRAAERMGIGSPLIWATYPMVLPALPTGEMPMMVYDCMDRWTDFPDSLSDSTWQELVARSERQLLEDADEVFCSAQGLYDAKRAVAAGRVTLLRNGADVEHFAPRRRSAPADIAQLPRPIIGYVGAIAEWVDFELLRSVALSRPEWSIVLIGPVFRGKTSGDARALRLVADLPNVHVMGSRPYEDVPAYLEAFDVATIPFKLNGLTEDTNPIKLYEYLAAGVPVVSTALSEVATLSEVRLANDAAEFVRESEAALALRWDDDSIAERIRIAQANSWEARASEAWSTVMEDAVGR